MENKLWKADDKIKLYSVTINVFNNCSSISVDVPNGQSPPKYHEVIGMLETQKFNLIETQRKENISKLKPKKKKNGK